MLYAGHLSELFLQIPVAAELQVTCPFFVPFNQASQVSSAGYLWPVIL